MNASPKVTSPSITVMECVEIEVDLTEWSTNDLLAELRRRGEQVPVRPSHLLQLVEDLGEELEARDAGLFHTLDLAFERLTDAALAWSELDGQPDQRTCS